MVREQPGPSVKQPLVKSNPRPRESCGRALCPYTRAGEKCRERCYRENVGYMGRCLSCAAKQREEGKEEKEIVWTTYHGETSRSVVSRAREHFEQYRAAMKRVPPPRPPFPPQGGLGEAGTGGRGQWEGEEEGSSWMADHTRSHHDGQMSPNQMDDYDFIVLDQFRKPLQRQIE